MRWLVDSSMGWLSELIILVIAIHLSCSFKEPYHPVFSAFPFVTYYYFNNSFGSKLFKIHKNILLFITFLRRNDQMNMVGHDAPTIQL